MGVTTVVRVGRVAPLWRWSTEKSGQVVASGFALSEKKAWAASIKKAPRVG